MRSSGRFWIVRHFTFCDLWVVRSVPCRCCSLDSSWPHTVVTHTYKTEFGWASIFCVEWVRYKRTGSCELRCCFFCWERRRQTDVRLELERTGRSWRTINYYQQHQLLLPSAVVTACWTRSFVIGKLPFTFYQSPASSSAGPAGQSSQGGVVKLEVIHTT